MSRKAFASIAVLALAVSAPAIAADFTFQYTLNTGQVVAGSFTGDRSNNLVTNISNIGVTLNGTPFDGPISAYGFFGYNGPTGTNSATPMDFALNAATVSFDPLQNNFLFTNTPPAAGPVNDFFYIFPWNNGGANQVATQVALDGFTLNPYNGAYVPGNWSLTEVVTQVSGAPEPSTWAMMLLGFGLVGVAMRKRPKMRTTVSFA